MQKQTDDVTLFKGVDKDLEKAESLARELKTQIAQGFKNQKDIDNFSKKFSQLNKFLTQTQIGFSDIAKGNNFKTNSKELDELNKSLNNLIKSQETLKASAEEAFNNFSTQGMRNQLINAKESAEELKKVLEQLGKEQFNKKQEEVVKKLKEADETQVQQVINTSNLNTSFSTNEAMTAYRKALSDILLEGKNVEEVFKTFGEALKGNDKELAQGSRFVESYLKDIQDLVTKMGDLKIIHKGFMTQPLNYMTSVGGIDINGDYHATGDVSNIMKYSSSLKANDRLNSEIANEQEKLILENEKLVQSYLNSLNEVNEALRIFINSTEKAVEETGAQIKTTQQLNNVFDKIRSTIINFASIGQIFSVVREQGWRTLQDTRELDKAFGQIAMVTNFSLEDMWDKYDSYAQLANKLGQSTLSVVQASGLYFQQGLEENEALKLTESTMKLATLAGLDFKQATSLMTAATRGFKMGIDDATKSLEEENEELNYGEHVTDVYSELAAHAAASVNDIAQAMSRTAAIANSAGMEFETTSAMLTTMIEATQESPETLGTAMKTVIARFTELKKNVSATESEFEDLDYNKVDTALKSIGVALKDANGQFRDIDDVFLDVADKWNTLDRNTQRYIATTAAGSRQQSRFIALMENSERLHELIGVAAESEGRSTEQFAKYADTLENKIKRLSNTWEQFRVKILTSDMAKFAVDSMNKIVNTITQIDPAKLIGSVMVFATLGKQIILSIIKTFENNQQKLNEATAKSMREAWKAGREELNREYEKAKNEKTEKKAEKKQEKLEKRVDNATIVEAQIVKEREKKLQAARDELELGQENLEKAKERVRAAHEEFYQKREMLDNDMQMNEVAKESLLVLQSQANEEYEKVKALKEYTKEQEKSLESAKEELEQRKEYYKDAFKEKEKNKEKDPDKKPSKLKESVKEANSSFKEDAFDIFSSSLSDAFQAAIITGITTGIASDDAKKGIVAGGGAAIAALLPSLGQVISLAVSSYLPVAIEALAPVATPLIGAILVAAAIYATKIIKDAGDKKANTLNLAQEEQEKSLKKLEKQASRAEEIKTFANQIKDSANNIEELKEKYEKLNSIQFKTTEQQEEYANLVKEIKEEYPDWINYENEKTGEIKLQTDLMERQLEIAKEQSKKAANSAIASSYLFNSFQLENELSMEGVETETALDNLNQSVLQNFIAKVKEEYPQYKFNDEDLETIFKGFETNGDDIDFFSALKIGLKGFVSKKIAGNLGDLYQKSIQEMDRDGEIERITGESADRREKIFNDDFERRKKIYNNYAADYYNADIELSEKLADIYVKEGDILTDKNVESYQMLKSRINGKEISELSWLANTEYAEDMAAIYGIKVTDDQSWRINLQEKMKEDDGTWVDLLKSYDTFLKSGQIIEQIDIFWDNLNEENYEKYQETKEKLTSGELTFKDLDDFSIFTGDSVLDDVIKKDVEQEKQKIIDAMYDSNDGINLIDFLGLNPNEDYDFNNFSMNTIKGLKNLKKNIIDKVGTEKAESVFSNFSKMLGSLEIKESDVPQIMSLFDFENIDASNLTESSELIKNELKDLGYSAKEADEIIENVFKFAEDNDIWSQYLDSIGDLDNYMNSVSEKFDNISKSKALQDVALLYVRGDATGKTTKVTNDEIEKIKELGKAIGLNTEQYYEYDKATKTYTVDAKKLYSDTQKWLNIQLNVIQASLDNEDLTEAERKAFQERQKELEEMVEACESELNYNTKLEESNKNLSSSISTLISSYKTMNDEMRETGHVSSSSIESLSNTLETINTEAAGLGIETKQASDFLFEQNGQIKFNNQSFKEYINKLIEAMINQGRLGESIDKDLLFKLEAMQQEMEETTKQIAEDNKDKIQSAYEEWQEALDKVREKQEAVAEAEEEVIEKEEELIEKQEELQKIYYGEENHKNQNDYLYNYNTELEQLEQNAKKAKEALDNLKPGDDVHQKVQDYVAALRDEVTNYKAQNEVIEQYMENQKRMLDEGLSQRLEQLKAEGAVDTSTNVSDFYYERNGRFYIDYSKLNAAKLPDDVSDFIEQQVDNLNKYGKAYEDNLSKIEAAQKEFLDWQKAARDKQIATENKVIEILKKKDQEELDNLKEKYDGMKAADDDYTSALEESIKKQRDLRNQASQWDDLAEKEKKLSLQQRDTSGANAKEIQKTQEDITKTRESLLDSAVDNIINNLKELYEEQEETRQAEIEYRQAILDNKNYVDEATAIINNWGSVEEAKAWFMKFDEEFINASDATIAKLLEDYEGYYNNTVEYTEAMGISYEDIINQTSGEIEEKVRETSETLTEESERALDETMVKVHEAQEKGREEVEAAEKAVEDAKNKVVEATRAVAEALEEARKKQEAYNEAIRNQPPSGGGGNVTPGYTDDDEAERRQHDYEHYQQREKEEHRNRMAQQLEPLKKEGNYGKFSISTLLSDGDFNNVEELISFLLKLGLHGANTDKKMVIAGQKSTAQKAALKELEDEYSFFASGGLVDYTGPAWVDGTPSKPEAFLSASDTEMIREFIDLQKLTFTRPSTDSFTRTNNYGDPVFNIDINVDSISSDYDVDRLVERVHEDILSITSAPGQSVILSK